MPARSVCFMAATLAFVAGPAAETPAPAEAERPATAQTASEPQAAAATQEAPRVHHLVPSVGHRTFAVREPVLRVRPGDRLVSETLWGEWYERDGGAWPGEVGPIYIEGATPDDTLVVRILELRPNRDVAVSAHIPDFTALGRDTRTPMLYEPLPARRFLWRLDRERMVGVLDLPDSRIGRLEVPLRPMLGRVAVAPAGGEAFDGLWPGDFGGNMDAADVREGATVYLPVFHEGAYFYFGDGHALQGDGEVSGTGLETTMEVTFEFDLIEGKRISWPRIEDDTHIMVAGSVRPLQDALRIAYVELIRWLVEDYGFDLWEAYQAASQLGTVRVANVVDPNYTVVARYPKAHLPQ